MPGSDSLEVATDRASIRSRLCSGRSWLGYALAVAATVLATLFRWALGRVFVDVPPFIALVPTVALVAMLAGGRAGALATVLTAIAADYFFFSPSHPLTIAGPAHAVGLGLYTTAGLLVSFMAELLNRARRRQAASERELLLQAMSEGIPDPLFIKDRDSRIIIANSATVRAIGKPAGQIVGHTDDEFYDDPVVARAMKDNDRRVMESGQAEAVEEFVPSSEGGRTFLSIKTPWRDTEGKIIGIIGCARDITERKRMEEALRESEARFQVLAAGTFEGIVISEHGRLTDVNEQLARMLGYEPAELIGMGVEVMLPPEVRERVLSNIRAGVESHIEHELVRKDGSRVAVEAHGKDITYRNRSMRITAVHDISERKHAEEALRRYELLASRSRDIILFVDRDSGRILEANAAAEKAYGYSREELVGLTLHDLRVDPEMTAQLIAEADAQGALFETVHRRRDGTAFPVEVSSQGTTIDGRRVLVSVVRDIAERMHSAEALRQSDARLRAFFEQAAVGTAVADPATGRFVEVNPRYCEITGYEQSELLGMTFMDMTHPEDRGTDREKYDQLATGQAREYLAEKRYVRKDGRVIWVQVAVGMVRDAQGHAVQSVGVIQDITERKRGEETLRESEAGLMAAQRLAHVGSWEWNAENDTASWSDETFRIFGLASDRLQQHRKHFVEMVHPEDRARVDQAMSDALSGAKEYDLDYRVRRPDGTERTLHSQAEVLRDSNGKPILMRGTVHDISERRQWEDQLKDLNATLEQRVAERTAEADHRAEQLRALAAQLTQAEQKERQRLATILHDHLQQLLASTKFHLGSFRRWVQDSQQRESLRQVDSLLDESLATSRGLMLDLSPPILQQGDMRQVLEWLAEWFGGKHGLAVEVEADEEASPQGQEVRVLLFEAVRELLFNVVKHGKVNQARVELSRAGDGRVQVVVRDMGAGFDPSGTNRGDPGSSGFGLLKIRERLGWLGGQMEVESAAGQGTQVTLLAPMRLKTQEAEARAAMEMAPLAGVQAPTAVDGATPGRVRVLLADDHEVMRNGLAGLLQMEPWIEVVGQASDGRQAVELALQIQPDVVIMDVSMPHVGGVEATRQIVAQRPGVKVIGLSMFDEAGVVEAMRSAGAVGYLSKTSGPDALVAAIRDCANRATAAAGTGS